MASSPAGTAPIGPSPAMGEVARHRRQALVLPVLAVLASSAAMVMLARQSDGQTLDYGVGLIPAAVPWVASCLSVVVALASLSARRVSSTAGSVLVGALLVATAWSVVILPLDAFRAVGLAPPLNAWGATTRLVLSVGAAFALVAALTVRRASVGRCPECRRVLPGRLDRLPRWPVVVAVAFALVYPTLRVGWALGGTFGTAGEPLDLDPAVAWGAALAGAGLVAFTVVLLVGRGPLWVRALLGLGGVVLGVLMAAAGGLAGLKAATDLATEGLQSVLPDSGLMTWTFVVVYGSWFVAGIGIIVGGLRFWAHRREACSTCRTWMGMI